MEGRSIAAALHQAAPPQLSLLDKLRSHTTITPALLTHPSTSWMGAGLAHLDLMIEALYHLDFSRFCPPLYFKHFEALVAAGILPPWRIATVGGGVAYPPGECQF